MADTVSTYVKKTDTSMRFGFLVQKDIVTAAFGCLEILQQTNISSTENSPVKCHLYKYL